MKEIVEKLGATVFCSALIIVPKVIIDVCGRDWGSRPFWTPKPSQVKDFVLKSWAQLSLDLIN